MLPEHSTGRIWRFPEQGEWETLLAGDEWGCMGAWCWLSLLLVEPWLPQGRFRAGAGWAVVWLLGALWRKELEKVGMELLSIRRGREGDARPFMVTCLQVRAR